MMYWIITTSGCLYVLPISIVIIYLINSFKGGFPFVINSAYLGPYVFNINVYIFSIIYIRNENWSKW